MEGNNNLSNLSFLQGTVSNEELDPRILATFYTTFKIGKIALLAVVEAKICHAATVKEQFQFCIYEISRDYFRKISLKCT